MANKIKEPYVKVDELIMKTPTVASSASTSNIGGVIISPIGPRLAYVTSPVEFLELYTMDGETIPRNADITFINAYYLSYYSGLVISRSINTNALGGVIVYRDENETKVFNYISKDDMILDRVSKLEFTLQGDIIDGREPDWAFIMNDVVYYSSSFNIDTLTSMPKYVNCNLFKECDSIYDMVSILENTDGVHVYSKELSSDGKNLTVTMFHTEDENSSTTFSIVPGSETSIDISYTDSERYDDEEVKKLVTLPDKSKWVFTLIGDLPLATDSNKIIISKFIAKGRKFDLTINEDTYRVALNQNTTENDVNIYIEYINTQNIGYTVTVYNNEVDFTDLVNGDSLPKLVDEFGASGYDEKESKKPSHIFEALDYLADQEIYDVEYLAPLGLTDKNITTRYQMISKDKKWFCPIDIPYELTTYSSIKRFSESLTDFGDNMPSGIVLGPFDRNSTLTGWYNYIAASTLYYERIMLNKQSNAEFAPVFKNDYGRLNYSNPVKLFKKSERTDLLSLDKPINWSVYSQRDNIYYLNDNRTFQSDQESVVCEEQNARIVWKISKDVAKIVDQFIGKYNTRTTRASVVDAITYYLEWNIMNKKFPPDDYIIQCDEYNNPDSLINENKLAVELKIRLYKAIKFVEVINRVFPLGVDFSTSI